MTLMRRRQWHQSSPDASWIESGLTDNQGSIAKELKGLFTSEPADRFPRKRVNKRRISPPGCNPRSTAQARIDRFAHAQVAASSPVYAVIAMCDFKV